MLSFTMLRVAFFALLLLSLLGKSAYGSEIQETVVDIAPKFDHHAANKNNFLPTQKQYFRNRRKLYQNYIPGVSVLCETVLSLQYGFNEDDTAEDVYWKTLRPYGEDIFDSNGTLIAKDYAGDAYTFGRYDSTCNYLRRGQTLTINATLGGCNGTLEVLNMPLCFGSDSVCSQSDRDHFVEFIARDYEQDSLLYYLGLDGCTLVVNNVESDGDGPVAEVPTNVPETCLEQMFLFAVDGTFFGADSYNIIDEQTGQFNGNTTGLELYKTDCSAAAGRIVNVTFALPDGCPPSDFAQGFPACIASSCTNDEAAAAAMFYSDLMAVESECSPSEIIFTSEGDEEGDEEEEEQEQEDSNDKEIPTSDARSAGLNSTIFFMIVVMMRSLLRIDF